MKSLTIIVPEYKPESQIDSHYILNYVGQCTMRLFVLHDSI